MSIHNGLPPNKEMEHKIVVWFRLTACVWSKTPERVWYFSTADRAEDLKGLLKTNGWYSAAVECVHAAVAVEFPSVALFVEGGWGPARICSLEAVWNEPLEIARRHVRWEDLLFFREGFRGQFNPPSLKRFPRKFVLPATNGASRGVSGSGNGSHVPGEVGSGHDKTNGNGAETPCRRRRRSEIIASYSSR